MTSAAGARLWCVRHAPVAVSGICYGRSDVSLRIDAAGAADVILAALEREGAALGSVWCSSAARTHDVAVIVAARTGATLHVDDRIAELSMGEWEGRPFADLERDDTVRFARWMEAWRTESPPGGETVAALTSRVEEWLTARRCAISAEATSDQLAVTHAGVIRAVRASTAAVSYESILESRAEVVPLELERIHERKA